MELRQITKTFLEKNGIKRTFLADFLGCDNAQVSGWLNGKRSLPKKYTKRLLEFLAGESMEGGLI